MFKLLGGETQIGTGIFWGKSTQSWGSRFRSSARVGGGRFKQPGLIAPGPQAGACVLEVAGAVGANGVHWAN
jgi:hypothetical protein